MDTGIIVCVFLFFCALFYYSLSASFNYPFESMTDLIFDSFWLSRQFSLIPGEAFIWNKFLKNEKLKYFFEAAYAEVKS